jgi:hypothetical protein
MRSIERDGMLVTSSAWPSLSWRVCATGTAEPCAADPSSCRAWRRRGLRHPFFVIVMAYPRSALEGTSKWFEEPRSGAGSSIDRLWTRANCFGAGERLFDVWFGQHVGQ